LDLANLSFSLALEGVPNQQPGYLLQPSQSDAIDVFDTVALLEPRRAVHLRHILRPASRDLSGDARSGNTNPT
jgi:hypothetical protein